MKNKVYIVGHSLSPQSAEIITVLATFPRIILSEINTHRMLSKNTSSSRAIPFLKMVEAVQNNPFIPFAWQKYHPGMQGSEYLDETVKYDLISFMTILNDTLSNTEDEKERARLSKRIEEKTKIIKELLTPYTLLEKTLPEWWLFARDKAVEAASILYVFDVTKQLCNRLLEPFMWTTMLITGSREGWDNFFNLRCPQYEYIVNGEKKYSKSWKDYIEIGKEILDKKDFEIAKCWEADTLDKLKLNKGQAEIHIMDLAEKIYDAMNESTPKQLQAGEWHIPFSDKINLDNKGTNIHDEAYGMTLRMFFEASPSLSKIQGAPVDVKISTAMAARTSYTVVGDEKEIDYQKMIELHDRLLSQDPPHSSPLEHCAIAMSDEEYVSFIKGVPDMIEYEKDEIAISYLKTYEDSPEAGWCNNLKGFIPYRYFIDNNIKL